MTPDGARTRTNKIKCQNKNRKQIFFNDIKPEEEPRRSEELRDDNRTEAKKKADTLLDKVRNRNDRLWEVGRIKDQVNFLEPIMDMDQRLTMVDAIDNMHKAIDEAFRQIGDISKKIGPNFPPTEKMRLSPREPDTTEIKAIDE